MLPGPDPTHPPSGIKAVIEMEPHTPPTPDEGYTRLAGSEEAAQQGVVPPQQAQQAEQGVMSASVREPVSDEALIESYEYFKYAVSASNVQNDTRTRLHTHTHTPARAHTHTHTHTHTGLFAVREGLHQHGTCRDARRH